MILLCVDIVPYSVYCKIEIWQNSASLRTSCCDTSVASAEHDSFRMIKLHTSILLIAPSRQSVSLSNLTVHPTVHTHVHCRFSVKAAERHIPVCSSIRAKPTMLMRGAGVGPGQATHSKTYPLTSRNAF